MSKSTNINVEPTSVALRWTIRFYLYTLNFTFTYET